MSERGHGRYGLRSGLRPFSEYQQESARRKDVFVRMTSAQVLNSVWFQSGSVYFHTFDETDPYGRTLDVVGVRLLDEVLTRAETGAELNATAGTYRYARDPGGTLQLGVHLAGGASPSNRNVLVVTRWHNATGAAHRSHLVHPTTMGIERLLNADLDSWSGSPAQPDDWTFESTVGVGASVVEQAPGIGDGTVFSAKIHGNGGSVVGRLRQSVALAVSPFDVGPWGYRLWGSYLTPKTMLSTQGARIKITDGASPESQISSDGRSVDGPAVDGLELRKTRGKMRLFCADFIGFATPSYFELIGYSTVASTFDVYFGRASLEKIHGWDLYEPNVAPGGLPEIYEGASDPLPGSESTGAGAVTLLNDGRGLLEQRFSYPWLWPSRDVEIFLGGAFESGQELLMFDMHSAFKGVINGDNSPKVNPRQATIACESYRQILEAVLPPRSYGVDWPDVAAADRNRPRPILFGFRPNLRAPAIEFVPGSPATGYRRYEITDCDDWPYGIGGVGIEGGGHVWAYPDEEAAEKEDPTRRVELTTADGDYSVNLSAGTVDLLHDARVIEVTLENNHYDFDISGSPYSVTIPVGPYKIGNSEGSDQRGLLEVLAAGMLAESGATFDCIYDEATHLVTITKLSKGGWSPLYTTSGTIHAGSLLAPLLGFDTSADPAPDAGFTSDEPIFSDADAQHVIRWDATGYVDDPNGRFTGTIESPPRAVYLLSNIFRFILEIFLKQPADRTVAAEWDAARVSCPQILALYLGGRGEAPSTMRASEIVDAFEAGSPTSGEGPAEIRTDGEGRFRFLKRTTDVPDDIPHIQEHDLVELIEGGYMPSQAYGYVEVRFSRNGGTGRPNLVRVDNEVARLAFQNEKTAYFETFLTEQADAEAAAAALSALVRAPIRHLTLVVKSKVLDSLKGDLIRLTVPQALLGASDPGPGLDGAVFRIESKKIQPETQRVTLVVYTNIIT